MEGFDSCSSFFDRVESEAVRLISSSPPTNCLPSLKLLRIVTSLAIFYRYSHANCSFDLANCMPPLLHGQRPRSTGLSTLAHPHTIRIPYARVN